MKIGKLCVVSAVSGVLALCTFVLWLATFAVSPRDHRISLINGFHISVWKGFSGDSFGRLVFFNNAEYGPYTGSIMRLDDEKTQMSRSGCHAGGYDFGKIVWANSDGTVDKLMTCDLPGIYFRHWRIHNHSALWTLMVSLWYPLFLFSILPAIWIFRFWRMRRLQTLHA